MNRRLKLTQDEARQLLWLRCLEEADATGQFVPVADRAIAGREAGAGGEEGYLVRRAAALFPRLPAELQVPAVYSGEKWKRLPSRMPWALPLGAFILGWATNHLGPDHVISILSFPLLGLIVWNLAVCSWSLVHDFKSRRQQPAPAPALRRAPGVDALTAAKTEFAARSRAWEKPALQWRITLLFHLAAIALTLGVVGGLYARGLVKKYTVAWESTFLSEDHVRTLTRIVLGPASLLTGIPVPEPKLQNSAAPWIHLWAASAVIFIVIPRFILLNMARRSAVRAAPDYRKEFAAWAAACRSMAEGRTGQATILPVHYEPEPRVRDALRAAVQHRWGTGTGADFLPPVAYGSEETVTVSDRTGALSDRTGALVVVLPLSATPESEVHGALLRQIAASFTAQGRGLIVLDASGFESRFRTLAEFPERLAARLAAWQKTAAGTFPVLLLDDAARRDPAAAVRLLS
jgi:hypothetical protein